MNVFNGKVRFCGFWDHDVLILIPNNLTSIFLFSVTPLHVFDFVYSCASSSVYFISQQLCLWFGDMIGLLGVLRWALRPLDKLWLTSAALAGTALTAPVLVMRSFRFGRARTMTTLGMWEACICVPFFGRYAFAGMVHFAAPYTGSVNPMLTVMKDKYAEGFIIERPWLHNPFNSVHAVAMTNLGFVLKLILSGLCYWLQPFQFDDDMIEESVWFQKYSL